MAAKRAVIYTRVSRDDSGEGYSNRRQEEDGRALAQLRGWSVVHVENDISVSAYSGKERPGWSRVVQMMHSGDIDVVIAWKLDRVSRTVRELSQIIQMSRDTGVGIVTTDGDFDLSTEGGKAVATILGAIAEMEVERKGARQRRANQQRRSEGKRWASGWRPFGYELSGEVVPEEAALIREAAQDALNGTPMREIARQWRDRGISTPRSQKGAAGWTHNGVRSILLNPRNAGLNTYKGEVIGKGDWEPILSEDTHIRLKAFLTNPERRTNPGRSPTNLLSGIASCGVCAAAVTGGTAARTRQTNGVRETIAREPVYKCPNNHISVPRGAADNLVTYAFAFAIKFDVHGHQLLVDPKPQNDYEALALEAERLRQSLADVAISYAEGRTDLASMELASSAINKKLAEIEGKIAAQAQDDIDADSLKSENFIRFPKLDVESRRAILAKSARIRLYPRGRGKRNVPMTQQIEMDVVTYQSDGSEKVIEVLNERRLNQARRSRLHEG